MSDNIQSSGPNPHFNRLPPDQQKDMSDFLQSELNKSHELAVEAEKAIPQTLFAINGGGLLALVGLMATTEAKFDIDLMIAALSALFIGLAAVLVALGFIQVRLRTLTARLASGVNDFYQGKIGIDAMIEKHRNQIGELHLSKIHWLCLGSFAAFIVGGLLVFVALYTGRGHQTNTKPPVEIINPSNASAPPAPLPAPSPGQTLPPPQ